MKMDVSIVIPCYRSEKTVKNVVDELKETFKQRPEMSYEIILVNDHSPDGVWNVIRDIVHSNTNIKGVSLAKNFGQHAAIMAGLREAKGNIMLSVDDDGQIPVDEIFLLIDKLTTDYDVVYGVYPKTQKSFMRSFGTWMNNKMTEIMLDKPSGLRTTSFWGARRFVVDEILCYRNPYPYMTGLILRCTKNIGIVEVNHRKRAYGQSGYNFKRLFALWINGFTAFSVKPLRMATYLGCFCAISGFIYGIIIIVRKMINTNIQIGYSSIMAAILFIGGFLMLFLGLIGEYIGRIYISLNDAPQYVVRERIGMDELDD